jgi:hypothetical protein
MNRSEKSTKNSIKLFVFDELNPEKVFMTREKQPFRDSADDINFKMIMDVEINCFSLVVVVSFQSG